jgi:uncharacterized protein YkwD
MSTYRHILTRAVPAALALGMLMSILPAGMTFAADRAPALERAEWDVLREINRVRNNHGVGDVRMAGRVRGVALDRSQSMKRQDYFDHVSPSGVDAGDMLRGRDIGHRYWSEIIGWTVGLDLDIGARWMVDWWKNSPVHRNIMLSARYNYAGVGLTVENGKVLWTVVFVNQADHTPPMAGLYSAARASTRGLLSASRTTTVRWWGRDRRLSVRTAGLHSFTVQHRRPGGRWHTVRSRTTARQLTMALPPGSHFFRIKARDNRGNTGRWQGPLRVEVP